ncbi:tetratricopeptide repeat protein [Bradyrhizobium sp.]|uniref:tetratricopeptide repeat protein n=1 Tax=Bradyrhizobium sp. TaxID=376 RepID=UPI003BB0AA2B
MAQVHLFWLNFKTYSQSLFGWIARTATVSNLVALTWIGLSVVICVLIVREVTRDVVTIEPISVPKTLADSGYTSDVASHRLRDAINHYASFNKPSYFGDIGGLNISARDELPDFVVPTIGLSLNAIVSSIQSVLHYSRGHVISGEMIFHDKFAVRVRVDGRQVYTSGFDSDSPDDLLAKAAPAVIEIIQPVVAAMALYRDHQDQGLLKADEIIAHTDHSDANVQGAFILKGNHSLAAGNNAEAEKMFRKAVSLHWSDPSAHNLLGIALQRQHKLDEAMVQFQRFAEMSPRSPAPYNNIGYNLVLATKPGEKLDAAIEQYRHAIELDPRYLIARNNLGLALSREGNIKDAISEYRAAIQVDPKYLFAHWNLAYALRGQNKLDDALTEFRTAIDCTKDKRQLAILHVGVGDTLKEKAGAGGNLDDTIAEYRRAIEIDPAYAWAHNNLGMIWHDQEKIDDAIAEFRSATQLEAANKTMKENLEQALKMKDAGAPKEASASKE